jgi:hypothetical protein
MGHSEYLRTNRDAHDSTPWEPPGPASTSGSCHVATGARDSSSLSPSAICWRSEELETPAALMRASPCAARCVSRRLRSATTASAMTLTEGLPSSFRNRGLCSSNGNASAPSWRRRLLVSRVLMEGGSGIFSSTAATFDQDQLPTGQLPMIGYRRRWVSEPALMAALRATPPRIRWHRLARTCTCTLRLEVPGGPDRRANTPRRSRYCANDMDAVKTAGTPFQ